jgi:organic hydroperoxide reductase OsmC/OhrA
LRLDTTSSGPRNRGGRMSTETVHHVHAQLFREAPPVRRARLAITGEEVVFGVPKWQGEHYGFAPGTADENPGTLDYLVASVAGCLIGTFGGALKARGITASGDALTADADGEVVVDPDGVLRLRKITVTYHLRAEEAQRAAAERVNTHHAAHCPNARSVAAAIEIVTLLDFIAV